ncbi:MAG: hypothetical protein R3Y26_00865 [Rikenellaceae bacterium]
MKKILNKYVLSTIFVIFILIIGYNVHRVIKNQDLRANIAALEEDSWERKSQRFVDKYAGKPLILPYTDSLFINRSEYQNISKLSFKVVNFLDGDCSTCLMKIDYWKEFVEKMKLDGVSNIPVVMYAFSSLEENLRDYMKQEWNDQNYYWQFDKDKSFIKTNKLHDLRFQTVLLDQNNNVILIGDPLLNPKLGDLYKKVIISIINE